MSAPAIPDISKLREYRAYKDHWDTRERHDLKPVANVLAFTPHHEDRVLVKRLEPEQYGTAMIQLPMAKQRAQVGVQRGLVIAVAPGVDEVQAGDVVLYARWPANEFEHEGEVYTFLYEEQAILAVLG